MTHEWSRDHTHGRSRNFECKKFQLLELVANDKNNNLAKLQLSAVNVSKVISETRQKCRFHRERGRYPIKSGVKNGI
jgi:hypothetical protein